MVNSDQYLINVGKTMPCLPSPRKITIFMTVGSGYQSQMGGLWHCFNHKKLMMSMMLGNSDFFWLWLWFYIDCYMFFFIVTIVTMIFWLLLWHCYCVIYKNLMKRAFRHHLIWQHRLNLQQVPWFFVTCGISRNSKINI